MIRINLEKCTGCGTCFDTCPVEAISLVSGQAAIDEERCLTCGACEIVCPSHAIIATEMVLAASIPPIPLKAPVPTAPPSTSNFEHGLALAKPVLTFIGYEIIPRLVDTWIRAIERRQSSANERLSNFQSGCRNQDHGGGRRVRRRVRCNM